MASVEQLRIYHHPNVQRAIKNKEIYVRARDGMFCRPEPEINTNSPWLFESVDIKPCIWCHKVLFSLFALCPSPALDCWKVVVRPRNVLELVALHNIQKKMGVPSKCGIEPRENVAANYGGYFYNRSFEDGLEREAEVSEIVHKEINKDVPVFLKRGCTGIEEMFGRSDKWKMAEGQEALEARLNKCFDESFKEPKTAGHPEDLEREIFEEWLHFAHSRGDMSYLRITKGRYLYPQPIKYTEDTKF